MFACKGKLMSKASNQELDLQIQLSLVARIRQAGHRLKDSPAEETALRSYVSALECLAEYVSAKCQESHPQPERATPLAMPRLRKPAVSETAKPKSGSRVIPFPSQEHAPLGAA